MKLRELISVRCDATDSYMSTCKKAASRAKLRAHLCKHVHKLSLHPHVTAHNVFRQAKAALVKRKQEVQQALLHAEAASRELEQVAIARGPAPGHLLTSAATDLMRCQAAQDAAAGKVRHTLVQTLVCHFTPSC